MTSFFALSLLLCTLCTLWIVAGLVSVARARIRKRSPQRRTEAAPAVSILKPLCGADPALEANLETFFAQDFAGPTQILFGVEDPCDPALEIARSVAARHPQHDACAVVHRQRGLNPKIANLRGMLIHAKHDLLLISDSNVRAPNSYVREAIDTFVSNERSGVVTGLVTNLFAGIGERDLGSALENVQLTGFVAAGMALPNALGDAAVVGKSMLFSRSTFEKLGGFESVGDLLAEDFIIGKKFQHAGFEVRLAPTVLEVINGGQPLERCLSRQLRWSMLRVRLRGLAFLFEPLASPLAMAPFAVAVLGPALGLAWALLLMLMRDAGQWWLLRGPARLWIPILLSPVRELLMLGVWAVTPFVKHVRWRGHRVRIGAGTHAFATR